MGVEKDKDEISGKILLQPLLQGRKILPTILSAVDNILFLTEGIDKKKGGIMRKYLTARSDGKCVSKNRLGLDQFINIPTVKEVFRQGGLI
jgi:hypothetical protein